MDCIVHGAAKSRTQLSNFHFHFSKQKVQSSSCSRPLSPLSHQTLWILTLKNLSKPPLLFIFMINSPHQKIFLACVTAVDPLTISLTSLQFKLHTTARRIKKNNPALPDPAPLLGTVLKLAQALSTFPVFPRLALLHPLLHAPCPH